MKFVSHSQAGQDAFLNAVLQKLDGSFVDVGCSHPVELSNTFALEQLGWTGVMLDSSPDAVALCQAQRRSKVICGDARQFDWRPELSSFPPVIDYASVDVDAHNHIALHNLMQSGKRFRVMTVEHDAYQRGDALRIPNRELLARLGYELIAADVHSNGCCFEDWFVLPPEVDMARVEPFHSTGLEWQAVLRKGGVS